MKASFTPKTHILLTLLWPCATPSNPNSSLKMALYAHISGISYDVPVTQKFKCILTFIKSINSSSITCNSKHYSILNVTSKFQFSTNHLLTHHLLTRCCYPLNLFRLDLFEVHFLPLVILFKGFQSHSNGYGIPILKTHNRQVGLLSCFQI